MPLQTFRLPDLGEGLTEGEILRWLVAPGETVRLNQPIVEVETAKAAVEVPSPYAGVVRELHGEEGATLAVGAPLITVDTDGAGPAPLPSAVGDDDLTGGVAERAAAVAEDLVPAVPLPDPGEQRTAVLVGYGVRPGAARRRPRRAPGAAVSDQPVSAQPVSDQPASAQPAPTRVQPGRASAAGVARAAAAGAGGVTVLAKPPVRRLARDLGVDLRLLAGSGPGGTVTRGDVEAAAGGAAAERAPAPAGPRGARERRVQRLPVRGVRKHSAAAVTRSAFTAPHVTEFYTVDATPTVDLVRRLRAMPEFAEVKVGPLLLVAKALLLAVRRHPDVNAKWDEEAGEIVRYDYVDLGIAAATPRGLVVPVIRDADTLALPDLARALDDLAATARAGRAAPADLTGSTITITNVGVFGVDSGTPILNAGEAAILAVGAIRERPWVVDGQLAVRQVVELALSFDHRLVDGELGSRVLVDVGDALADPARLIAWS